MQRQDGHKQRMNMLDFIERFVVGHEYSPSYREIMLGCGISSTSVVKYHLDILQEQGYILRMGGRARAIKVVQPTT